MRDKNLVLDWILFLLAGAVVAAVMIGHSRIGFGAESITAATIQSASAADLDGEYWKAKAATAIAINSVPPAANLYNPQDPNPKNPNLNPNKVYVVFAPFKCTPCDIQRAGIKNWQPKEFDIVVVAPEKFPIPIPSYPCTAWKGASGTWVTLGNWTGRDGLLLKWRASQMVLNKSATAVASVKATAADFEDSSLDSTPAQFAPYNSSQLRSFAHSYNGPMTRMARKRDSYWYHLLDHGFAQWQIQGLNESEAAKIHGAVHAGLISPTYQVRRE